ncbi:MAG: transposase [Microgenomates group bacterium]
MSLRKIPLVTEEIYHVVNRGVGAIPIFTNNKDYQRFTLTFRYYQNQKVPFQFSKFLNLSKKQKEQLFVDLGQKKDFWVEIIAYCLMPNHFHFLLKQKANNGILNFIRLTTDSYSKYFNIKNERKGSLFEGRFKAIRVENETQLIHLTRYIHLNPYSSFVVKSLKNLLAYPHSSLGEYLNPEGFGFCQKELIYAYFKTPVAYREFVFNQADFQRNLEIIKHQLLER